MASQTLKERVAARFLDNDSRLFNPSHIVGASLGGRPMFRKGQPSRANGAPTE